MELAIALVGIAATFFVWYLQRRKGRVQLDIQIEEKPFDPRQKRDVVYSNSDADKAVSIKLRVQSRYSLPIIVDSFVVAVPKSTRLKKPPWLLRNLRLVDNIPLDISGYQLPAKLLPGEELEEVRSYGLAVAQALERRGYTGQQVVMFGLFDENKNSYYSRPFEMEVESWLKDRGYFLMGFF